MPFRQKTAVNLRKSLATGRVQATFSCVPFLLGVLVQLRNTTRTPDYNREFVSSVSFISGFAVRFYNTELVSN